MPFQLHLSQNFPSTGYRPSFPPSVSFMIIIQLSLAFSSLAVRRLHEPGSVDLISLVAMFLHVVHYVPLIDQTPTPTCRQGGYPKTISFHRAPGGRASTSTVVSTECNPNLS